MNGKKIYDSEYFVDISAKNGINGESCAGSPSACDIERRYHGIFSRCSRKDEKAFTYITAMILIAVTGIALGQACKFWKTAAKREREMQLLFCGDQIRLAIASYYAAIDSGAGGSYPRTLKDLLKDPRFPGVKRHLRRIYRDPMTMDGQWGLIIGQQGGIEGIFSRSKEKPLKNSNFPKEYSNFENTASYADWKFICLPRFKGLPAPVLPAKDKKG